MSFADAQYSLAVTNFSTFRTFLAQPGHIQLTKDVLKKVSLVQAIWDLMHVVKESNISAVKYIYPAFPSHTPQPVAVLWRSEKDFLSQRVHVRYAMETTINVGLQWHLKPRMQQEQPQHQAIVPSASLPIL